MPNNSNLAFFKGVWQWKIGFGSLAYFWHYFYYFGSEILRVALTVRFGIFSFCRLLVKSKRKPTNLWSHKSQVKQCTLFKACFQYIKQLKHVCVCNFVMRIAKNFTIDQSIDRSKHVCYDWHGWLFRETQTCLSRVANFYSALNAKPTPFYCQMASKNANI